MRKAEVDAVVAALPVSVLALTGYRCSFERAFRRSMHGAASDPARQHASFAVVTADGERTLVVDTLFAPTAGDRFGKLETYGRRALPAWRAGEIDAALEALAPPPRAADAIDVLAQVLRGSVARGGRVAVEAAGLVGDEWDRLCRGIAGFRLSDGSGLVRRARMCKSPLAIDRLRASTAVAEAAFQRALSEAGPGVSTLDLLASFRRAAADRGADVEHFIACPRGLGLAVASPYVLSAGEVLYVDVGCDLDGIVTDTGTTLALETSAEVEREHAALDQAIAAGAAAAIPGATPDDVEQAVARALDGTEAADALYQTHGIGLEPRELPFRLAPGSGAAEGLCSGDGIPLAPGMTINIEASLYRPGRRSVAVERSFVLGPGGAEPLVQQDRRRPVTPA